MDTVSGQSGNAILFDLRRLNAWSPDRSFKVTKERIKAYSQATNDDGREHRSGDLAPPVFAVVPIWEVLRDVTEGVAAEAIRLQAVHGEQDIRLHAPIFPGMDLLSRGKLVGIQVKHSGTTITAITETRTASGQLLNEQYMTGFYRGIQGERSVGTTAPSHTTDVGSPEPAATVTYYVDEDQTLRYAEASGDRNPFHLDDEVARGLGLPGIIVHGLCTMAFTSRAVVASTCGGDSTRLTRLAVRFSRYVLPGQHITTRLWPIGQEGKSKLYAFDTVNSEGAIVIKDGLAEVANEGMTHVLC